MGPGGKTTFSLAEVTYESGNQLWSDIAGARVLVSNMDPSNPQPPAVTLTSRNRCAAGERTWALASPINVDPAGLSHARQLMADITLEICPMRELCGGVVRNNSAAEASVWAAWTIDLGDLTMFSPPTRLAPGEERTLTQLIWQGLDATEVVIMTDGPATVAGDPAADLAVAWIDTCAP